MIASHAVKRWGIEMEDWDTVQRAAGLLREGVSAAEQLRSESETGSAGSCLRAAFRKGVA